MNTRKQQADNLARIAAEKRRPKTTPTDSAEPQKSQASQSRVTKPAKKYDQNYPLLLLQNRFSALQDSTLNPRPQPLPRSGSLPGYTTKRPTSPPPPPKPKTPSYLKALLSQKPPTPSEGPPRKQPRQFSSDKLPPQQKNEAHLSKRRRSRSRKRDKSRGQSASRGRSIDGKRSESMNYNRNQQRPDNVISWAQAVNPPEANRNRFNHIAEAKDNTIPVTTQ
ncbi:hypothetical protein MRX96_039685 [Rhipicephalus microplus]